MSYFKTIMMAGAVAVTGMFGATNADALTFPLSGVFNITAYNYNPLGTDSDRQTKSQATVANFEAARDDIFGFASNIMSDTFTYTGALKFRVNSSFSDGAGAGDDGITTIAEFLGTGGGTLGDLDTTFGNKMNSAGGGASGDGTISAPFTTATIYKITAQSLNIDSLAALSFVLHDDGISLQGANKTIASVGPNTEKNTSLVGLTGGVNDFVLYYASANGDPSILEVNAVPLPAAAWLLMGVAGALVAAKRRNARRAA